MSLPVITLLVILSIFQKLLTLYRVPLFLEFPEPDKIKLHHAGNQRQIQGRQAEQHGLDRCNFEKGRAEAALQQGFWNQSSDWCGHP